MKSSKTIILQLLLWIVPTCSVYSQSQMYNIQVDMIDSLHQYVDFEERTPIDDINLFCDKVSAYATYNQLTENIYLFQINSLDNVGLFVTAAQNEDAIKYMSPRYTINKSICWATNSLIVKINNTINLDSLLCSYNIDYDTIFHFNPSLENTYIVNIAKSLNSFYVSSRLRNDSNLIFIQPSFYRNLTLDDVPSDSLFNLQWNLFEHSYVGYNFFTSESYDINILPCWNLTKGDSSVKIAVIDDGIDFYHPDLLENILSGSNFTPVGGSNGQYGNINEVHGTKCASIICAQHNSKGIAGISSNSKLVPIKAFYYAVPATKQLPPHQEDSTMLTNDIFLANSLLYACDSANVDVINCSWSYRYSIPIVEEAINYVIQKGRNGKGIIVVASSGNGDYGNDVDFPASLNNVIAVGSCDYCGMRVTQSGSICLGDIFSYNSCYGEKLDLVAPGVNIPTCTINGCYNSFSGTSAAAPHVAGVAALMLSADSSLTYRDVFEIICSTTTKSRKDLNNYTIDTNHPYGTWNNEVGYGLLNAHHALLKTLYRDYQITGDNSVSLCETGLAIISGTRPFNDTITSCWTSSANLKIISYTDTTVSFKGVDLGEGWIAFNIIHSEDTLPIYLSVNVTTNEAVWQENEISANVNIQNSAVLSGNITVTSTGVLTIADSLYCSPTARIVVRPGGRLVVDGGVLTSACEDGMWEGIYVEGDRTRPQTAANQGTVELKNGAVIENAICGITTSSPDEQWLSTGGVILADSASFRNCRRAVAFLSYADTIGQNDIRANQSRFNKCSFSVDDDNHFSANGTSFYAHASLWDVNGVRFNGCTFTNTMTGRYANSGRAIYSEDAGFSVKTLCGAPDNMNIPCECPAAYATYSSASGFSTAVETNTTGSQYGITLDEVRFSNNARAVAVNGNNHATVTRCEFDLQSIPQATSATGLYLNNCTGYVVEENNFHRTTYSSNADAYGIKVNNSGTDNNSIYRNTFSNLNYGIFAQANNGVLMKVPTGLTMSCNSFNSCGEDIYVPTKSTIRHYQGSASMGADNDFSHTRNSSLYSASNSFTYYYSNDFLHQPRNAYNFTLIGTAGSNGCASTLCAGIIPGTGPGLPIRSSGGEYAMLKNRYDSLLTVFSARGFDDVLTDADANPVVEDSRVASAKRMQAELASLGETLHRMAHAAVRGLKNDTVTDLGLLADWYAATPGLSSRYAEHELAPSAILAAAIADNLSTAEERDEYDNYSLFVSTKRANWPASTESDIEMLRRIAERNTGRSSEMAKGVLCFFFDECVEEETTANTSDTRSVRAVGGEAGNELSVYPNPSSDKLSVYSSRLAISSLQLFDAFGKLLLTRSVNDGECELDLTAVPAGIYLLKAELEDGSIEVLKVVKK